MVKRENRAVYDDDDDDDSFRPKPSKTLSLEIKQFKPQKLLRRINFINRTARALRIINK